MHETQSGIWIRQPDVSLEMLDSVYGLNHRFLEIVGTARAAWRSSLWAGPSAELAGQVAPLTPHQKKALAHCPYALFDLRFHDENHWQTRLQDTARWTVADDRSVDEDEAEFVRLALFFAWHVATTATLAARFLLGMNAVTATAFRGVTIDRLPGLATTEAAHLTARWSHCPRYWTALTRAASRPNSALLRRVQLSGLQLTAADHLS